MMEKDRLEITEYCKALKLTAIRENFEEYAKDAADPVSYLKQMLQCQVDASNSKAVDRRIKDAKFPCRKYLEDLDMRYVPKGLKEKLPILKTLDFIKEGKNIILYGNPGTGKTHTATGLGIRACEEGYKVLFITIPYLVTELKEAKDGKKLGSYQKKFRNYDLVIADELGYVSFDQEGAELLFTSLSQRVGVKSTIITSNLAFTQWSQIFGGAAITGAMADRLTSGAYLVDMTGDSYRLRETLRINGLDEKYVMEGKRDA